jgi:hexokinase
MSIMLPVTALSDVKFAGRPKEWRDQAKEVLVNTECSMFGHSVLPRTRWDEYLNKTHELPDFQPYEYLIGGRYLSEIVRLIMVEAVQTAGLFNGEIPHKLQEPYSLETGILAQIEA